MFDHKITKWIILFLILLPIIPILFANSYLIRYSGFDGLLRTYISIILIGMTLSLIFLGIFFFKKRNKIGTIVLVIIACIVSLGSSYFSYVNANVYKSLSKMTAEQSITYYNLVTMTESKINETNQLIEKRIGILNLNNEEASNHIVSYLKENEIFNENEIVYYDSPIEMVHDLYENKVDAIIIGGNFQSLFSEKVGFETIESDTLVLDVIQVKTSRNGNTEATLTENPFSILLIGIDAIDGIEETGLADSLILATFNPKNLSITMTSIPRDTYVPIPYFNYAKDKITHSNNGGTNAVVSAVENLFDLEIPYYVKVNFSAVVELVDTLGGIEVDVPISFEEQNSRRQFGDNLIKVEKGRQILDGEQALALARHRKTLAAGDLGRANNQQLIIEGIINQSLTEMDTVNEFLSLLNVLGNNIETNLTVNDMTAFAQYLLGLAPVLRNGNPLDSIHMMNMILRGESQKVMTPYYSFPLSVFLPYEGSLQEAKSLMSINLDKEMPFFPVEFMFNGFGLNETIWLKNASHELLEDSEMKELPSIENPNNGPYEPNNEGLGSTWDSGLESVEPEIKNPENPETGNDSENLEDESSESEIPPIEMEEPKEEESKEEEISETENTPDKEHEVQ